MTESQKREMSDFDVVVSRLLGEIERAISNKGNVLTKGDVSAFRRMDPSFPAPAFWKLMAYARPDDGVGKDDRWAVVVKAMALMAPNLKSEASFGAALAKQGFSSSSDLKISRLLKAEGASFDEYLLAALRYLAGKAQGVNWGHLASYIHWPDQKRRLQLAKDFYTFKKD